MSPRSEADLSWAAVDVLLADGGVAHLRPIQPDDADALVAFHERLSPETRYFRFFSYHPELSPKEVDYFTHVDYERRLALVLELRGALIAVGRYDADAELDSAEVAFVVSDDHQGRGVGTLLLEYLALAARKVGISHFFADTLASNQRMLRVFREAGYTVTSRTEDGVVRVEFALLPTPQSIAVIEEREHRSEAASIARLLRPESVAVIGASRTPGSIGHELFANILRHGYGGVVYPVNPSAAAVAGVRAWPSVRDVPGDVDLAVIAVPASAAEAVVADCADKNVKGLLIITGGFAEVGAEGGQREIRLLHLARAAGMRVIGPNCIGVVNSDPAVHLNATFAAVAPVAGRVGFLSQSGALGIEVLSAASESGVGVSSFVSVGNKADVSGNDLLQYWEDDENTDVVLLYLESFGNPRKFGRLARRISRKKPIVVVKSGRSTVGQRAASSHTAALASSDRAVDALFRHTGVIRVRSVREMLNVAQLLVAQPLPRGRRVAILGNSGGPGILAADECDSAQLQVNELTDSTRSTLEGIVPPSSAVANPIDMTAAAGPAQYRAALRLLLDSDEVDAVVVIFTPTVVASADQIAAVLADAARGADKPVVVNFLATPDRPHALSSEGVTLPWYRTIEDAVGALGATARYGEWRARPAGARPEPDAEQRAAVSTLTASVLASSPSGRWLTQAEVDRVLDAYGIARLPSEEAADVEGAIAAAGRLGYPVALKAAGADILHKTDIGGVALDLASGTEVADAFTRMSSTIGPSMTGAVIQRMARPGVETIVGLTQDPSFGPIVMFGLGGVAAELLGDVAFRVAPLTDIDADELIREPRSSRLLFGYRGAAPADVSSLATVLLRVGLLAAEHPHIAELDLNPVRASDRGAVALDARIRVAPADPPVDARRLR
ncbi:MAG TPA: GNAT family N-acetyltransferase [Acidimicrobiales bacterium]